MKHFYIFLDSLKFYNSKEMARWLVLSLIALTAIQTVASFRPLYPTLSYAQQDSKNNATEENVVPIQPIPGTDLYTGIYYKLGLQRFPFGWVTWTDKKHPVEGWHYIQIDSRSDHQAKYQKGRIWYNDTQWFFVPSETEPGWYYLKNRQLSDSVAMISKEEKVGNGFHIVLANEKEQDQSAALWKPIAHGQNETGPYKLVIKAEPNGTVTWTEKLVSQNAAESHFIQVDINPDPEHKGKYEKNSRWYLDSLFRFDQGDRELIGEITQLQLLPKFEEMQKLTRVERRRNALTLANGENRPGTKDIQEKIVNRGRLSLKLKNFPEMKIVSSAGLISPALYADSAEFQTVKQEFASSEEIKLKTEEISEINRNVTVPGWSSANFRIYREYFDTEGSDVDTDAWVYLTVSEKGDRPSGAQGKYKAVYGKLPAEEFASKQFYKLLESTRGELEDDINWETVPVAGGSSKSGESGLQILGRKETDMLIKSRALVKGRFGFRTIISANEWQDNNYNERMY